MNQRGGEAEDKTTPSANHLPLVGVGAWARATGTEMIEDQHVRPPALLNCGLSGCKVK